MLLDLHPKSFPGCRTFSPLSKSWNSGVPMTPAAALPRFPFLAATFQHLQSTSFITAYITASLTQLHCTFYYPLNIRFGFYSSLESLDSFFIAFCLFNGVRVNFTSLYLCWRCRRSNFGAYPLLFPNQSLGPHSFPFSSSK